MKINSVKLRGMIGIKKGLGLDEIELDFSDLAGLIAFDGPNGRGKSTILENLSPYATLASRPGALSHHCYLRDSFRELSFNHQGMDYKTLIKIDAESGRSEGYVYVNGHSEVNGKISEYKRYINNLFGSQTLFFNSVFCAQNAEKISDMTTGQLKSLFSEFLRLDKYIEWEGTSKQAGNIINSRIAGLDRDIENLASQIELFSGLETKLNLAKSRLEEAKYDQYGCSERIKGYERDIGCARQFVADYQVAKQRLDDLQQRRSELIKQKRADAAETEKSLQELRDKRKQLVHERHKYTDLLDHQAEIKTAALRVETLKEKTKIASADHKKLSDGLKDGQDNLQAAVAEINAVERNIEKLENDHDLFVLRNDIKTAERDYKALDLRDPECRSTTCSFIVEAVKAKDRLPELRDKFKSREKAVDERLFKEARARHELIKKRDSYQETVELVKAEINKLSKSISELETEIESLKPMAGKAPQLEVAMGLSAGIEERISDIENEGTAIKAAWVKRDNTVGMDIMRLGQAIKKLQTDIANDPQKDIDELYQKIDFIKNQIADLDKAVADRRAEIAGLEKDIEARNKATSRQAELKAEREKLVKEMAEWRYLQQACGKDGLRALEIDSVAPVMSGYANRLLHGAFGPSYSIKMMTQDDQGREILDIIVLRDDGTETLIENLSGGERVWSLKALRLAQTLLAKERSGRDFKSVMADEEDGALDVGNAQAFVRLYREFMAAGGFEDCFYITHKPECVAMADHVVTFNGGVRVE